MRGDPVTAGITQLFTSRRDAAEYLVSELLRTVWLGAVLNLHPPRLPATAWVMLSFASVIGATAIDVRAQRLARSPHGGIDVGYPLGVPMTLTRGRQVFGTAEPWKDAFRWLGIDPEKAPSARYVTLWTTGILFGTALIPILMRQMSGSP